MLAAALAECCSCVPACVSLGLLAAIRYAEYDAEKRSKVKYRNLQQRMDELNVAEMQLKFWLDAAEAKRADLLRHLGESEQGTYDVCGKGEADSELEGSYDVRMSVIGVKAGLRIPGFESARSAGERHETPRSSGSMGSGRRSIRSQEIIADLLRQNQELVDELAKMQNEIPDSARSDRSGNSSVRSDASQRIIEELRARIQKLQEEKGKISKLAESADGDSPDLAETLGHLSRQNQELTHELAKARNQIHASACSDRSENGSVRSDTSQRIIEELQSQIQKLQDETCQRSRLTEFADRDNPDLSETIDHLLRQNQELTDELNKARNRTPRSTCSDRSGNSSVRSSASQRIIEELQAQIQKLQESKGKTTMPARRNNGNDPELGGKIEPLMRHLHLPEECITTLAIEGIDFLSDLENYREGELVELGFKKAHAKRLLKAAAAQNAPDNTDTKLPTPVPLDNTKLPSRVTCEDTKLDTRSPRGGA